MNSLLLRRLSCCAFVLLTLAQALSPIRADIVGTLPVDVSVDNKGAANATIPLQIPPGRDGLQPKLALVYNSGAGNGPVGIGWSVSTGFPQSITRGRSILARDGVTRGVNFDENDKFYLDGKRLICVSGTYGQPGSEYRTEVDSFVTITTSGSGNNIETFTVTDKTGVKMIFGKYAGTSDGYQPGTEYTGDLSGLAYAYAIKRVEDAAGNYLSFSYINPNGPEIPYLNRPGGQHLLSRIDYTGGTGVLPPVSIALDYVDGRPDVNYSYVGRRSFPVSKKLNKIEVEQIIASAAQVTARYTLIYNDSSGTVNSRLTEVRPMLYQSGSSSLQAIPAVTIQWVDNAVSYTSIGLPASHQGSPSLFGDVNGDGRDDMINCHSGIYVAKSTGSGFSEWEVWSIYGGSLPKLCDINGDGLKDIVFGNVPYPGSGGLSALISNGSKFVCLNGEDVAPVSFHDLYHDFRDPRTGSSYFISVELESIANRICTADFNGDGRDDILIHRYDGNVKVLYSYGTGFHGAVEYDIGAGEVYAYANIGFWPYNFLGWCVSNHVSISQSPCDLNGDGRADYVWTENKQEWFSGPNSTVSPMTVSIFAITSLPEGGFSSMGGIGDYWYAPASYNWGHFRQSAFGSLQGDVNGDGLTDFLVIKPESLRPSDMAPGWGWQQAEIEFYLKLSQGGSGAPRFHTIDLSGNNAREFTVNIGGETMVPIFDRMTHADFVSHMAFDPGSVDSDQTIEMWRVAARLCSFENMSLEDINGDGKADYVWYVRRPRDWEWEPDISGWYVMYSLGASFSAPHRLNSAWPAADPINIYADAGPGHYMHTRQQADINGDGISDTVTLWESHRYRQGVADVQLKSGGRGELVDSITDGVGRKTDIAYKAAKDASLYTRGAPVNYPIREVMASTPVVSDIYKDAGSSSTAERAHYSYQYSGNRLDLSGRGGLGFHSFVTLDHQTNLFKYQFLTQSFPMTGLTTREQTYRYWVDGANAKFRLISSHDNTVVFDEVVNGPSGEAFGTVYPFISQAIESRWENSATAHFTFLVANPSSQPDSIFTSTRPSGAHITITAKSWFDEQTLTDEPQTAISWPYNVSDTTASGTNAVTGIVDYAIFDSLEFPQKITHGNLRKLSTDFGDGFTETVTTTYKNPLAGGVLSGRVDTVSTTVSSTAYGSESTPTKSYTYWGNTPLVETETVDASDNALDLTTTYTRGTGGRVEKVEISGYNNPGHSQHIGSYTVKEYSDFDSRFNLPREEKNNYGHPTIKVYHPFFGLPTSVTDVNGAEVTTDYDALGRATKVRDELKELQTDTTFAWDNTVTVSPPAGVEGLSLTSKYSVQTSTTVQPSVKTYYDRLGRSIRKVKESFGTQQAITDTIYNNLGQVVAVSLPYTSGATPLWTKTTYDVLGRVRTVTAPNDTVTTTTYNGRISQVTVDASDRDAQTNTTYVDAKGRTVKVWNADNLPASPDPVTGSTTPASLWFKLDGFGRMRETVLKDQTQTITATYDPLGRQTALNDPDKGNWTYINNALGQIVSQTDGNNTVTASIFDRLSRPLIRTTTQTSGPVETAKWFYYDTATNAGTSALQLVHDSARGWIGAPQREEVSTSGLPGYPAGSTLGLHYYDSKGRPEIQLSFIDGKWFYSWSEYDAYGRLEKIRHFWKPAGHDAPDNQPYLWQDFGFIYDYDDESYLIALDDTAGKRWWEAATGTGYDHLDRPVLFRKGTGHWTKRIHALEDGLLTDIDTGSLSGSSVTALVQNLSFGYDGLGNLTSRGNAIRAVNESYGYDNLNRLTHRNGTVVSSYFDNGNIDTKTDVSGATSSAYTYDTVRPHAVTSAWGYSMTYDGNGNLLTRTGGGATWTTQWAGFDKPRWLAKTNNGTTVGSEFHYNANRSRVLHLEFDQLANGTPTHYTTKKIYAAGPAFELDYRNTAAAGATWALDTVRLYVPGPDGSAGAVEYRPGAATPASAWKNLVYHNDHLGSLETITLHGETSTSAALDESSRPGRYSYDAWGERRNADTWSGAPVNTARGGDGDLTPRGFTGHEMLDDLHLVHMNGRIYDPLLGRMLSADLVVPNPGDLQGYNRYTYVLNNPLTVTDPSGFFPVWASYTFEGAQQTANAHAKIGEAAASYAVGTVEQVRDSFTAGKAHAEGAMQSAVDGNPVEATLHAVAAVGKATEMVLAVLPQGKAEQKMVGTAESLAVQAEKQTARAANRVDDAAGGIATAEKKLGGEAIDAKRVNVDPKTAPVTEAEDAAKGGTYKLKDPETGEVKRTGRTNDHDRRRSDHGKTGTETEGLDYEVDTRTDDYAEQRGREQVIHDQHPEARHPNHVEGGSDGGLNKKRPIAPDNPRKSEYEEAERRRAEREKNRR